MFNFVFIYVSDAANLCFVTFVANDFEEKTFILSRETAKESKKTVKIKKGTFIIGVSGLQIRVVIKKHFSYFSTKTYVLGTQVNCPNEMVLRRFS